MGSTGWKFNWIDGGQAAVTSELRCRWDAAFESHGNIWQCREFVRCWDETMAPARGQRPILLFASYSAGNQVIYPLYERRRMVWGAPVTIVEPMGGAFYCDYQDPLSIGDPMRIADWEGFLAGLRSALPRRFGHLSELRIHRLTELAWSGGGGPIASTVSPFIPLDSVSDLQMLLATRGPKLRKAVGRTLRQLQDRGGYVLRRILPDAIPEAIDQFCRCYAEQWGQGGRPHVLQNPETRLYWLALAEAAAGLNKLHFTVFEVGGEPWHWHLGFEHRGVLLWYKPTYDIRFGRFSPGTLHLASLIEEAISAGMRRLDLGCGAEEYKHRWTDHNQPLLGLRAGGLAEFAGAAREAIGWARGLKRHLPNFPKNNGRTSIEA